MDIEGVAAATPEKIFKTAVDINAGMSLDIGIDIAAQLGFPADSQRDAADQMLKLYDLFLSQDATMVEINPMALLESGEVMCMDTKLNFDDNAEYRQASVFERRDTSQEDQRALVRHVVQDEPDDEFILGDAFNKGISILKDHSLIYDILIYERQLGPSITFVDRHPQQIFVLDHIAKPRIGESVLEPWTSQMFELAKRENVYCKISGVATEAEWDNWTEEQLAPYLDTALEAFGPSRLMFGSDWPVALLAVDYANWVGIVEKFASKLTESEQARLWGETAIEAYKLSV